MTRSHPVKIAAALATLAVVGAPAAAAQAGGFTGGSPSESGPASTPAPSSSPAYGVPIGDVSTITPTVVATGTLTLRTRASAMLGSTLSLGGSVPAGDAGLPVVIQRLDPHRGWLTAAQSTADRKGAFVARWRTNLLGRIPLRGLVGTAAVTARHRGAPSRPASSQPAVVTVYRPALATIFGPGFYGSTTACGQRMTPQLVGVAHRTLPCGTMVEISYGDRRMTVPVLDRGPYANHADWDLTAGAAAILGVNETVRIGAIAVARVRSTPSLGSPPAGAAQGQPSSSGPGPGGGAAAPA